MTTDSPEHIDEEIRANAQAQRDAMVRGDADALGALLAPDFTLTHMTGYLQPRREWLDDIAAGRMIYHSIDNVEVTADITPDTVSLTSRSRTHATIWGTEGTWQLRLRTEYVRAEQGWIASRTVADTW